MEGIGDRGGQKKLYFLCVAGSGSSVIQHLFTKGKDVDSKPPWISFFSIFLLTNYLSYTRQFHCTHNDNVIGSPYFIATYNRVLRKANFVHQRKHVGAETLSSLPSS